jgi:hypothetical protein
MGVQTQNSGSGTQKPGDKNPRTQNPGIKMWRNAFELESGTPKIGTKTPKIRNYGWGQNGKSQGLGKRLENGGG